MNRVAVSVAAIFIVAVLLGIGWQSAIAADDLLHSIVNAEVQRTADPSFVAGLLDADPPVAARAALALGRTGQPAAIPPLRAHLHVRASAVRAMVVYALGLLDDAASLPDIRDLARRDENSAVRYAASDAIGRILAQVPASASAGVASDLLKVAASDSNAVVRGHALVQLGAFRGTSSAGTVELSLERIEVSDEDGNVRWHAAWMLARSFAEIADVKFLKAQLRDASDLIRIESVRALGIHGAPGAEAIVRTMLSDPSWRVQLEVGEALRRLAHEARTEHLTADPTGLHLPAVPALPAHAVADDPPVASPSPAPKIPPPDTSALDLGVPFLPLTASEMNGPLPGPHPRVLIQTTKGDVVVRLYPEWAPTTVASFLALTQSGFFNGNRWFRIVPDFVVQTGDPTNTGDGDPGYTIPAEENPIEQRTGVISMGLDYKDNLPVRDSAGSQFYITLSPQLHLDRSFSTFGEVESGFDVLAHLIESDRMTTVSRLPDR